METIQHQYYEEKAKGYCIRSRANWIKEGEVCSRYFLGLEKQRQQSNNIRKVKTENDTLEDNEGILSELVKFYENLYKEENICDNDIKNYLDNITFFTCLEKKRK